MLTQTLVTFVFITNPRQVYVLTQTLVIFVFITNNALAAHLRIININNGLVQYLFLNNDQVLMLKYYN